jgi:hypothetical protein
VAIFNADDDLVAAMADRTKAAVTYDGTSEQATVRATDTEMTADRAAFHLLAPAMPTTDDFSPRRCPRGAST